MGISTAIDSSAVARVLGIKTNYIQTRKNGFAQLPQQIAVLAQGATASTYSTNARTITSEYEAGSVYGFGSPIHLIMKKLKPANGVGGVGSIPVTVYPLTDGVDSEFSDGGITATGEQTTTAEYKVVVNGIESNSFVVNAGEDWADTALLTRINAAINAVPEMPVIASTVTGNIRLRSKWKGLTANAINAIMSGTEYGLTFVMTTNSGGLVNPSITDALALINTKWETMIIQAAGGISASAVFDEFSAWGESRWGALVYKPAIVFTGTNSSSTSNMQSVTDARKSDRTNAFLNAPGSKELGFCVGAAMLAQIAVSANNVPAVDYGSLPVVNLLPGGNSVQFDYSEFDSQVKAGCSTSSVRDGVVFIEDTVTMYHPTGEVNPGYRYVVDIVKCQNIIYNVSLIFKGKPWDGAPLIPNDQPTVLAEARKPKDAIAELAALTDGLALNAIISDGETTKKAILAEIDSNNPKRLNAVFPVNLSGNANIISVDFNFSFFFG